MSHVPSEGICHVADETLHQDSGKNLTTLACPTASGLLIHDKTASKGLQHLVLGRTCK